MKFRYIILVLILFPLVFFSACKRETDPIFEQNATLRVTEAIQHAYDVLQGNEPGWMMKYYPSDTREFGGYTIFAKFISNGQVTLTSDINEDVITSTYGVVQESGPVLTFNGYNKVIHYFSEPGLDNGDNIGADDTGMKGDFEFIVLEASADSVVLKGKKSGNRMVMLPLTGNQFETLSVEYQRANDVFRGYLLFKLENQQGELSDLGYNMRTFQYASDGNLNLQTFRVTPTGLEFYEDAELSGVRFVSLAYVQPTATYPKGYFSDANNLIKVIPEAPLNLWFRNNLWSMSYSNVGATGRTFWNTARTNLTNNGISLSYYYIGTYQGLQGMVYILQNGAVGGLITHNITLVPGSEDQVRISLAGNIYNLGGGFGVAYWSAGLNQLTNPFNNRTFRVTADTSDRPNSVLLTDIAIPTNTFRVFLDAINNPFNN
ncbi:DUF4302 domain-containing protein [Sphingobacterium oryzagri]|uniref:DUF4302 domain-containing protein n=1 Tax=Sphingobacterium oryzagri TaxID=3025669 RepID=A0ABY7WIF9_9SPHI|nr:DUF4302 domain-containing protein [Sphingobacterium sp. KACC 22765]WDF69290.1 DUF4302 domain-containing protein [Sphingobacterium sp. KACC 22765]